MKKLIFLFAFIGLITALNAQNTAYPVNEGGAKYFLYAGVAGDTVNGSSDSQYITWQVGLNKPYFYEVQVYMDELSGSATGYTQLEWSNDNVHWNLVDTLATYQVGTEGLTADGSVYIGDLSTGVQWKHLRIKLFISTTGKWGINYVTFRAVGKND